MFYPGLGAGRLDQRKNDELGGANRHEAVDKRKQLLPPRRDQHSGIGQIWSALGESADDRFRDRSQRVRDEDSVVVVVDSASVFGQRYLDGLPAASSIIRRDEAG